MSRPMSRENRKKAFMNTAEILFDEIDDWYAKNPEATFEEMEERLRRARRKMMGRSLEIVINGQDVGKSASAPVCEECGQVMKFEGYREKTINGVEGDSRLERAYYVCENCDHQTLFPPRQETTTSF